MGRLELLDEGRWHLNVVLESVVRLLPFLNRGSVDVEEGLSER